jgi:GAF domain-containing protein
LKGTEIPIGARILSVVDCFDALTSDRPYRRALSNDEALQILNERKGNMYDPWVVQVFEQVHERLDAGAPTVATQDSSASTTRPIEHQTRHSPGGDREADSVATGALIALECEAMLFRLRPRLAATAAVFFRYEPIGDQVVAHHVAAADGAPSLAGLRIARGQQLSGWVAANRQSIMNSDPALDLGDAADAFSPRVRYTLSIPVCWGKQLIGVLSLYSCTLFSADDERVCRLMTEEIVAAAESTQNLRQPVLALEPVR